MGFLRWDSLKLEIAYAICIFNPPPRGTFFDANNTAQFIIRHAETYDIFAELGTRSLFPGSLSAHFISMDRYRSSAH